MAIRRGACARKLWRSSTPWPIVSPKSRWMIMAARKRLGLDWCWRLSSSSFKTEKVSSLQSLTKNARSMLSWGYVNSDSNLKCCWRWEAASRSGVRMSTRSRVFADVTLMDSKLSDPMINGSRDFCCNVALIGSPQKNLWQVRLANTDSWRNQDRHFTYQHRDTSLSRVGLPQKWRQQRERVELEIAGILI